MTALVLAATDAAMRLALGIPPFHVPRRPRLRKRQTRGYELSGALALYHHEWALVHGHVDMGPWAQMGHAWNERDGWVYDSVLDQTMPAVVYAALFSATEAGRWQGRGLATVLCEHGHWGPWDATATPAWRGYGEG